MLVLLSNHAFCQEVNDEMFKQELNTIINDAATGFRDSRGACSSKGYGTTYYDSRISFFNKESSIGYTTANYLPASEVTTPEAYFLYQGFGGDDVVDKYLFENAERIFDEVKSFLKLKKVILKQDKNHKDRDYEIDYVDKNKKIVLAIEFDLKLLYNKF